MNYGDKQPKKIESDIQNEWPVDYADFSDALNPVEGGYELTIGEENELTDESRAAKKGSSFDELPGLEVIGRREANVKHYSLGNNRYQAVLYPEAVHYIDRETGVWREIDNTLEASEDERGRSVLKNRANGLEVELAAETGSETLVKLKRGEHELSWRFEWEPVVRDRAIVKQPLELMAEREPERVREALAAERERAKSQGEKGEEEWGLNDEGLSACIAETASVDSVSEISKRVSVPRYASSVLYGGVAPGISARYELTGDKLKEDIIIEDAGSARYASLSLPAEYEYEQNARGGVDVSSAQSGEVVFRFAPATVVDSGEYAESPQPVKVELKRERERVTMRYHPDPSFLAEATYPITIDPTVYSPDKMDVVSDTYLLDGADYRDSNYGNSGSLRVGEGDRGLYYSLIRFERLVRLNLSCVPVRARLRVRSTLESSYSPYERYVAAYEVLRPWEANQITYNSFNPLDATNVSDKALDYINNTRNDSYPSGYVEFDLTGLYRKWMMKNERGVALNNGVMLRRPNGYSGASFARFQAKSSETVDGPQMIIDYVSRAGVQSRWQYEGMSAGRAGGANVDLFTGNVCYTHGDGGTSGARMPVSVAHYYNSCNSAENGSSCGYGWKLSAQQYVYTTERSGRTYYVLMTGSGTEIFFRREESGQYRDEIGLGLKLKVNNSYIEIKSKGDGSLRFKTEADGSGRHWLYRAIDAQGNDALYSYDSAGRLTRVEDGVRRQVNLSYNGSGLLASIESPGSPAVYYEYDGTGRLTGIRYADIDGGGRVATSYGYDGNLLTSARNYDDVEVRIGYEPENRYNVGLFNDDEGAGGQSFVRQMLRASTLECVGGSGGELLGGKREISYWAEYTEVRSIMKGEEGKRLRYHFNDGGGLLFVRDELGQARFTQFEVESSDIYPTGSSKLMRTVINKLVGVDGRIESGMWEKRETGGTITGRSAEKRCLGLTTVKMVKSGTGESAVWQTHALEGGRSYTLSAYVQASGLAGGEARLKLSGGGKIAYSLPYSGITTGSDEMSGWERLTATLELPAGSAPVEARLMCEATTGTVWFGAPQLEEGLTASSVNLLYNGDFAYTQDLGYPRLNPIGWTRGSGVTTTGADNGINAGAELPEGLSGNALQFWVAPTRANALFTQRVEISGSKDDIFVVGGWAKADSASPYMKANRRFDLRVKFLMNDGVTWSGSSQEGRVNFTNTQHEWQFACGAVKAHADYKAVEVGCVYSYNVNIAMFTNIFLNKEEFGKSFGYDANKNLVSASTLAGQSSDAKYDEYDNLTSYVQAGRTKSPSGSREEYVMTYGTSESEKKRHLVRSVRTPMKTRTAYEYDDYGNRTETRRHNASDTKRIRSGTTYSTDGNYPWKSRNSRGYESEVSYDEAKGLALWAKDPNNQRVSYAYDGSNRLMRAEVAAGTRRYKNEYRYEKDRLTEASHNTSGDGADVMYRFEHDELGRQVVVKVGNPNRAASGERVLSRNVYASELDPSDRTGELKEVRYGNDEPEGVRQRVINSYDEYGRVTEIRYDGDEQARYTWEYGAHGGAARFRDHHLKREHTMEYDLSRRPVRSTWRNTEDGGVIYQTTQSYDVQSNPSRFVENVGGKEVYQTEVSYDADNRVTELKYMGDANQKLTFNYDDLGRLESRADVHGQTTNTTTFAYAAGENTNTTDLIEGVSQPGISFAYEYDSRGNITKETRTPTGGGVVKRTTYGYDELGQLTRVNSEIESASWTYEYDQGGNILYKRKYAYTTGTLGAELEVIPYAYSDPDWKDLLTDYNELPMEYDAIGNLTNDGWWTYEWEKGRQLSRMSTPLGSVRYEYDSGGLRVSKITNLGADLITTNYTWNGEKLTHMTYNGESLHFLYGAGASPARVRYDGVDYYYVYNLQGDVVGILDGANELVVEYTYDAWGCPLSTTGSMSWPLGVINPFRYRGYIYDPETELYYLRSRYYAWWLARFINADVLLGGTGKLLSHNLFTYCRNNPIRRKDSNGSEDVDIYEEFNDIFENTYGIDFKINAHKPEKNGQLPDMSHKTTRYNVEAVLNFNYYESDQDRYLDDNLNASNLWSMLNSLNLIGFVNTIFGSAMNASDNSNRYNLGDIEREGFIISYTKRDKYTKIDALGYTVEVKVDYKIMEFYTIGVGTKDGKPYFDKLLSRSVVEIDRDIDVYDRYGNKIK